MRLKPQSSPKQVLETQVESLRSERSALSEEVTRLLGSRNALQREIQAEGDKAFASLRAVEQECQAKKQTLLNEILSLEARRKLALTPLEARRKALDEREAGLATRDTLLAQKEAESLAYQSRLAELQARISDRNAVLNEKEQGIARKERQISLSLSYQEKSVTALADKWQEFRAYEAKRIKELDEKAEALALQEESLEKTRTFNENEKERLNSLRNEVNSRRQALAQALKLEKTYAARNPRYPQ